MTPFYLNPPSSSFQAFDIKEDPNLQLFLSPHHSSSSSSSLPNFLNSSQDHRGLPIFGDSLHHDHQVVECTSESRRMTEHELPSSSFEAAINGTNEFCEREDGGGGSGKWVPSKLRLMHKMMNSSPQTYNKPVNTNQTITRVCSDCNTTTTPLWRSGPKGPKSLCNACGIRQRKARRAMAAAAMANGGSLISSMETSPTKCNSKEKKLRTGHVSQCKKLWKPPPPPDPPYHHHTQKTKLCFKNLTLDLRRNSGLPRVFPQDVEEAAILLMELSCGFIHG